MTSDYKPDWPALMAETARATKELIEEAERIAAAESGMLDAASEWTKAWRIISAALKEMRCPECDHNARAIIARLAAQNMLIVGIDNVNDIERKCPDCGGTEFETFTSDHDRCVGCDTLVDGN